MDDDFWKRRSERHRRENRELRRFLKDIMRCAAEHDNSFLKSIQNLAKRRNPAGEFIADIVKGIIEELIENEVEKRINPRRLISRRVFR